MFCLPPLFFSKSTTQGSRAFYLLPLFLLSKISRRIRHVPKSPPTVAMFARLAALKVAMLLSDDA
jgi:hypothetical protein